MAYFKLAFLFGVLAFNLTDATFKALHPSFFAFFAVTLGYPRPVRVAAPAGQRASTTRVSLPGLRMPAPALSPLQRRAARGSTDEIGSLQRMTRTFDGAAGTGVVWEPLRSGCG